MLLAAPAIGLLLSSCAGDSATRSAPPPEETPVPAASPPEATTPRSVPPAASPFTLDSIASADDLELSITSPVSRGGVVAARVKTVRTADCTIVVTSSSGPSSAEALQPKAADGAGNVSWSWTIPADAAPGSWTVEVTCLTVSGLRAVTRQTITVR
jgi:hypothetical protein